MAEKSIRGVPVSRFSSMKLLPLTDCQKAATLLGIRLPDGTIVVSPEITNYSAVKTWADMVGGAIINVSGIWKFEPADGESSENISSSAEGTDN